MPHRYAQPWQWSNVADEQSDSLSTMFSKSSIGLNEDSSTTEDMNPWALPMRW